MSGCPALDALINKRVWKSYIPFESYQVFQRGAYFSLDIVPDKVGALSLNTIYWFEKNKGVWGVLSSIM